MDVKSYCDTMGNQLIDWKAKLYDMTRIVGEMTPEEAPAVTPLITRLNALMDELDAGLVQLATECPVEWATERESVEAKLEKVKNTLAQLSEKVGVPDTLAWLS